MFKSTITLKLYKPSLNKRTIIDEAMVNYTRAFRYLLERASKEIDYIEEMYGNSKGRYNADNISKWIQGPLDRELNVFSIEPFKDSIKIDFGAVIAAYLKGKAKGSNMSYPSIKKEERPIFFCRYSLNRNYSLLYNAEKDRYYAKIYLLNVKNKKRKRPEKFEGKVLRYISRNNEIFMESNRKRTFLMFPLAFGEYQEKYLKEAMEKPEIIKTARLIKRKNQYFLSINIIKDVPEEEEFFNYMGVSRGLENIINYSIADCNGKLLIEGNVKSQEYLKIDKFHSIANDMVEQAKRNHCQIVIEKSAGKGDKLFWKEGKDGIHMPFLSTSEYIEFTNILNYKLRNNGLPAVIPVESRGLFQTCPRCGNNSKENRFSKEMLMCTTCGSTIDIEKVGSMNLARRLIKYDRYRIKIKVEETEKGLKFTNKVLDFEYYPSNPYQCEEEFFNEVDKLIKNFYENIEEESMKANFKKKYSFIKKIEKNKDVFELI